MSIIYSGFFSRFAATLVDWILIICITSPVFYLMYGDQYMSFGVQPNSPADIIGNHIIPFIATLVFWLTKSATPGKMLINAKVLDAKTLKPITVKQALVRYFGYLLSILPCFLGILWVAIDPKKQGWHDKLASTVVVHSPKNSLSNV